MFPLFFNSDMKVSSRGPIVHFGSSSFATGRSDWASGRDLSSEERRCGLLSRVADIAKGVASPPLLSGVVKAQTSDFLCNEINAEGAGSFLQSRPIGRWRKISRQKTLLVETSHSRFSDVDKSFAPMVQSYGDYVRMLGKLPKDQPVLSFVMYNDGYSHESILNRFRYEIGVERDAVRLHSIPAGCYGCSTQSGVSIGVTKEQLAHVSRHYNLHPLIFDSRHYYPLSAIEQLSAEPSAYVYRILLRCVDASESEILKRLEQFSKMGFVNYFGMERFGVGDTTLFDISAMADRGDWRQALGACLQNLADSNPFHRSYFMSYVNSEESTASGTASAWSTACKEGKSALRRQQLVDALHSYHVSGCQAEQLHRAWSMLNIGAAARHSAAEFVWNAMASQRIISYGLEVQVGDVVAASGSPAFKVIASEEEARTSTIEDVVLPVPYHDCALSEAQFPHIGSLNKDLFVEFAVRHGFQSLFSDSAPSTKAVTYRRVVRKAGRVQAAVLYDPSSCATLKNDLFLLQERKPICSLDLDYKNRVRPPCQFNVSERFAERMETIRRHKGKNSVALSFVLPADASPLVALRECFHLKYANFHDLYFTY